MAAQYPGKPRELQQVCAAQSIWKILFKANIVFADQQSGSIQSDRMSLA